MSITPEVLPLVLFLFDPCKRGRFLWNGEWQQRLNLPTENPYFSLLCYKRSTKPCWENDDFLAERGVPIDNHPYLLNICGDQIMDVSIVRQGVMCFSRG